MPGGSAQQPKPLKPQYFEPVIHSLGLFGAQPISLDW